MRHTGRPHLVQGNYNIQNAKAISVDEVLSGKVEIGGASVNVASASLNTVQSQIETLETSSPTISENGLLSKGIFTCSDEFMPNSSRLDITHYTYNNKKVFWVALDAPEMNGTLNIESIKVTLNKVYIEQTTETFEGMDKQSMIDLAKKSNFFTHTQQNVTINNERMDVIKENFTLSGKSVDGNFEETQNISIEAEHIPVLAIAIDIPDYFGQDYENVLFEIVSINIKGSFEADHTYHLETSIEFEKIPTFIHFKDKSKFIQSLSARDRFSRAIYCINYSFEVIDVPVVAKLANPAYVFATMEMFKAYGITSFCYDYEQIVRASVFNSDYKYQATLLGLGYEWPAFTDSNTQNQDSSPQTVSATYYYYDEKSSQIETVDAELPVNGNTLNIENTNLSDVNYAVVVSFPDNPSFYKDVYFMVERKKINVAFLSAKHIRAVDTQLLSTERGYTESFLPASQLTQQALYGLADGHAWLARDFLMAFLPMSFLGGGAMFMMIFSTAMWYAMWAVAYGGLNLKLTGYLRNYRDFFAELTNIRTSIINSFVGRDTNIVQAYNNGLFVKGNDSRAILDTSTDSHMVPIFGTMYLTLGATEITKGTGPYTVDFDTHSPSDFFDLEADVLLTDELRAWALIGISNLFNFNFRSSAIGTMSVMHYKPTPAAKTSYKSYTLIEIKDGAMFHPVFDMTTGKIFGVISPGEVYGKPKLFKKKLQEFIDRVESTDTQNEYIKFVAQVLKNMLPKLGYVQLSNCVLGSTFRPKDLPKIVQDAYDVNHADYFSTPLIFSHDENTLTKPDTVLYNYPTSKGTVASKKTRTPYGFYLISDPGVRKLDSFNDYFRKVLPFTSRRVPYILL